MIFLLIHGARREQCSLYTLLEPERLISRRAGSDVAIRFYRMSISRTNAIADGYQAGKRFSTINRVGRWDLAKCERHPAGIQPKLLREQNQPLSPETAFNVQAPVFWIDQGKVSWLRRKNFHSVPVQL